MQGVHCFRQELAVLTKLMFLRHGAIWFEITISVRLVGSSSLVRPGAWKLLEAAVVILSDQNCSFGMPYVSRRLTIMPRHSQDGFRAARVPQQKNVWSCKKKV